MIATTRFSGKITINEESYRKAAEKSPNASIPKELEKLRQVVEKAKPKVEQLPEGVEIELFTNDHATNAFYTGEGEWAAINYHSPEFNALYPNDSSNRFFDTYKQISRGNLLSLITGKCTLGKSQKSLVNKAIREAKNMVKRIQQKIEAAKAQGQS
jgi:hypothetical protein